jgi:putative ABC transport system permease protein
MTSKSRTNSPISSLRGFASVARAVEAVILASTGGAFGALAAWLLFDGYAMSTLNFQSMSQLAFAFAVTPALVAQGIAAAVSNGIIGAMWPAWHAATVSVTSGLRKPQLLQPFSAFTSSS